MTPLLHSGLIQFTCEDPLYVYTGIRFYFPNNIVFCCVEIYITFTNSEYPDEIQLYAAFHVDLLCLKKYSLTGLPNTSK